MPDRSIRNIEINHRHANHAPAREARPRRPRRRYGRLWLFGLIVIAAAAVLGALLSLMFAGATVEVTPRSAKVTLPSAIQAALNAPVGTLSYQEADVSLTATTTVPTNGIQQVSKPASGELTIQNTYSSQPQTLIANTRFQAPDGKVYRIRGSVVVPGMQNGQAGTVKAIAYADTPGVDYNRSGTTVYTIPGFKGKAQYAKITAVSGPITGGFVGSQPAVADADLAKAKTAMEVQLDAAVRQQLASNLPQGYQVIGGSLAVTFGDLSQSDAGNGQAAVSETASAHAYVLRTADVAAAVARQTVQGYSGEAVSFADPSSIQPAASTTGQASSLNLALGAGDATLVWQLDPQALKQALVGQPKSNFEAIIRGFQPAAAKADATIRPFWTSTFPTDPNKISVKIQEVQ